jgi:uncharacterized protein (DUF1697 family)
MPKYVAFLRAINVGGHIVKMENLRKFFEALEFANVETFIASGNVIFDSRIKSAALEKQIEKHLLQCLGYNVATYIRTIAEVQAIATYKPFPAAELNRAGHSLFVAFLTEAPSAEVKRALQKLAGETDDFKVNGREVYCLRRVAFKESIIASPLFGKVLGAQTTMRNITTVRKLAAKYSQ